MSPSKNKVIIIIIPITGALEALAPPGRWYHISDQRVSEVTEAAVERAQAYILFYERIY